MKTWGIVAAAAGASLLAVTLLAMPQNSDAPKNLIAGISSGKTRVIDLSYAINDHLPPWPGDKRTFEAQPNATFEKDGYFTRSFWMLEHYGTHIDAPIHFAKGGATVDQIPPQKLFGPGVVIDVRDEGQRNHDYALTTARIDNWEKAHGKISAGAIVFLRTGWAAYWKDAKRYRGLDEKGANKRK